MTREKAKPRTQVDIIILVLMAILMATSAFSLKQADWTDSLGLLPTISLLGVAASAALSRSRFRAWIAFLFSSVYGLFIVGFQLVRTIDPAMLLRERIMSLFSRMGVFFDVLIRGEPNRDPLMFVMLLGLYFWFCGSYGAWSIFRRKRYWPAVLPAGIGLLINAYFYIGPIHVDFYVAFYVFVSLLLAMWFDQTRRQALWESIRAQVPPNVALRIARSGLLAALALVLIAWATPALARARNLSEYLDAEEGAWAMTRDWFQDLLHSLRSPVMVISDYYGDKLPLEAGVEPLNVLVMHVDPDGVPSNSGRFYWRAQIYNYYEAGSWTVSLGEEVGFNPRRDTIAIPDYAGREEIDIHINSSAGAMRQLYIPSQPVWVSRTAKVRSVQIGDGFVDVLGVAGGAFVMSGEEYWGTASVSTPTGRELIEAGEDYPGWVLTSYLQLPQSISERTLDLASEITEGQETPYDKAVAVTRWLRANISYSRETEAPPEGVDPVDWFLFDYGIGFCNYYASAEVIMLRSLGIPARIAAGYAKGTLNLDTGGYDVFGEHAHAWPEVFFPGYGWVEFEPTASEPPLDRLHEAAVIDPGGAESTAGQTDDIEPEEDEAPEPEEGPDIPDETALAQSRWRLVGQIGLGAAGLAALTLLVIRLHPVARIRAMAALARGLRRIGVKPPKALHIEPDQAIWQTVAGRIYARWSSWLSRLDIGLARSQTPNERQEAFQEQVPEAAEHGQTIVQAYTRERYGGLEVDEKAVRRAWWRMLPDLWKAWFRVKTRQRDKDIYVPGRILR